MISYSNTSKLLFFQGQNNAVNTKSRSSQRTADTAFKTVFENTVNGNSRVANDRSVSRRDNNASQNAESKIKYKSYKDIERDTTINSKESSVENANDNAKVQNVDSKAEELQKNSKANDETINLLAQMLGIQPAELVKLANELGFSAEDLTNADKLPLFMDKLSSVLELNASQKAMMNMLAMEISKQLGSENSKDSVSSLEAATSDDNEVKTNSINNIKTINLSEIAEDIKAKMDKLIQNAEISQESITSEISKVVEAMRAQTKGVVSVEQEALKTDTSTDVKSVTEESLEELVANKAKEDSAKADNSKSKEKSENAESNKAVADTKIVNNQVAASNTQNQQQNEQNLQAFADIKINAVNNQTQVHKAEFVMSQPVRTSEVINQVVEQAKVIIGQDKSEMIIHLKPDHLGKLELKVVTEQGIVAAKFIAESHQVKEIIETNMQLLKDSLEKQGLAIDNVSVQVGQEKQSNYNQQNAHQSNNKNNGIKFGGSELNTDKVGYNVLETLPERLAQYGNETNTVNFIA
ncbi:flagellar hook-length control protein FliK [Ruminiclostridium herbifermentans]|uniref:Flagellar hook-length control protein FliK n=1 Tax=Ruminiclostridium herbifermentans TaxID=2488810 RepID=A0A4U7JL73_9FIRM|nr:flagellar hook-length control protein FliK [Ruminiclostridium herbifermentans]QNU68390.1 flagellar hook-length control protein FliK [Ruminiclostridium herbifermentans]